MKKILFINTYHNATDDRTFYHQANALAESGAEVFIFSAKENKTENKNNIQFCSKNIQSSGLLCQLSVIKNTIKKCNPEAVICDSPVGILGSFLTSSSLIRIYDITEWIPSKKFFTYTPILFTPIKFTLLLFANLLAGLISHKHIYGEYYKSLPFKVFFWKKKKIISYYPDLRYIPFSAPKDVSKKICINYSGWLNTDKGFDNVIKLTKLVALIQPEVNIELELIGEYSNSTDKKLFERALNELPPNIQISKNNFMDFTSFCQSLSKADIFLDLRRNDFENTHCLPIKLFYYMAAGRPVIYNKLKAIRRETDINKFGVFLDKNLETVAHSICSYISDQNHYNEHCNIARKLAFEKYNWKLIKNDFVAFVIE